MLLDQAQGHADQSEDGFRYGAVGDEIAGKHVVRKSLETVDDLPLAEPLFVPPLSAWC